MRTLVWTLGALLLLAPAAVGWVHTALRDPEPFPVAPLHPWRHPPELIEGWLLLQQGLESIPQGESVTALGEDPGREMELYMLALSLLPSRQVLPSTYYGLPLPEVGPRARYILALPCEAAEAEGEPVARVNRGCVRRRR